jgi:hypothetical protein
MGRMRHRRVQPTPRPAEVQGVAGWSHSVFHSMFSPHCCFYQFRCLIRAQPEHSEHDYSCNPVAQAGPNGKADPDGKAGLMQSCVGCAETSRACHVQPVSTQVIEVTYSQSTCSGTCHNKLGPSVVAGYRSGRTRSSNMYDS